jgi:hypothetical protein
MNNLLEPKLIGLMNNDKERLIMGRWPIFSTFRVLSVQYFREMQVVTIINWFLNFHKSLPKGILRGVFS